MHSQLLKMDSKIQSCINQDIINEIIQFIQIKNGSDKLFLRYSEKPMKDLETGLSASFFNRNPYSETIDEAVSIMMDKSTEDDYFIPKEIFWKNNVDFKNSKIYKAHLYDAKSPSTCPPALDTRNNKVIINPEFGLSSYLLSEYDDLEEVIKRIITNHYMFSSNLSNWHIFKAEHYHHGDTDSYKECLEHSERIVCMINARYICPISSIIF